MRCSIWITRYMLKILSTDSSQFKPNWVDCLKLNRGPAALLGAGEQMQHFCIYPHFELAICNIWALIYHSEAKKLIPQCDGFGQMTPSVYRLGSQQALLSLCFSACIQDGFFQQKWRSYDSKREVVCHCTTRKGRSFVTLQLLWSGNGEKSGITVETLHNKSKRWWWWWRSQRR